MFIQAEKTRNWAEHLVAIEKVLDLYTAPGHFNYTKSTRLCLQTMFQLEYDFPCYIDNLRKNDFIVFSTQTNTGQGFGPI